VPTKCSITLIIFWFCIYRAEAQQITLTDACQKFSRAVVRIDTERMHGTGFIVSPDGWIVTAAHVVVDSEKRHNDGVITVVLPDGSIKIAEQLLPISDAMIARDFAVLKVEKGSLPYLDMGDEDEAPTGSSIAIIGFPLSANTDVKFCLSGSIAAQAPAIGVGNTKVDIIYFQGPSVKGISGSPVISLPSGKVVGIVTMKLSSIGSALARTNSTLEKVLDYQKTGRGISIENNINPAQTIHDLIDTLDNQLANGLGAATGSADAAYGLRKAQREYQKSKH
jgi:S1-C subfamily serine protease